MTRKDYEALGTAIHEVRSRAHTYNFTPREILGALELEIGNVMFNGNPRFDRERFKAKCRGEPPE